MDNTPQPIERLLLKERHGDRHDSYLSWQVMYGADVMVNIKVVKQGVERNFYVTLSLNHLKEVPALLRKCAQEQEQYIHEWSFQDHVQARPRE